MLTFRTTETNALQIDVALTSLAVYLDYCVIADFATEKTEQGELFRELLLEAGGTLYLSWAHLIEIFGLGLGPTEQKYLQILAEKPNRLNVIASMLGQPARTVSNVIEPFLMRAELLVKEDQGRRVLTEKGQAHLKLNCTKCV